MANQKGKWIANLVVSALFAVGGGICAYFGWLGWRGPRRPSYDLKEAAVLSLVLFVFAFVGLILFPLKKSDQKP